MKLFAISDLHLPGGDDKPMNIFGDQWEDHFTRISANWKSLVQPEDTVLIAGDISWAMQFQDAVPDLLAIAALPGKKVMLKGNHDYWWSSVSRIRSVLPEEMTVLQHDAADLGDIVVCGSRGWNFPTEEDPLPENDLKLYKREVIRMEMALREGEKLANGRPMIVMTHFPPLSQECDTTEMTALFERFRVHTVVYGHLHGQGIYAGINGTVRNVRYRLTSCDSLNFCPTLLEI